MRLEKIGKILTIFVCLLLTSFAYANEISVEANVDRNVMRPGDTFTYSISIKSNESISFDEPKLPDITEFNVIASWSGSQMSGAFVNGQMRTERSQMFNYKIEALKVGKFKIGAAEITVDGKVIRTNPVDITVTEAATQGPSITQQNPNAANDPFAALDAMEDDMFSQLLRRRFAPRGQAIRPSNPDEAFFIHVEVDKTKVYEGEQLIASWYLVTQAQIVDLDTLKYPSLNGFWKEDIEVALRLNFQPEVINGVPYQKALLASYALFPIKAGTATIDAYRAKGKMLQMSRMGWQKDATVVKESETIKIEVLPLPIQAKPQNFSGGVGDFTVSATVDTPKLSAGTPATYKVRIEGRGNAKFIDMPKLNLPENVQVYDTKSEMKFFANGRSYKEFETLLVPKVAGELRIPPLEFAFFNPEQQNYYLQTTGELTLQVTEAENQNLMQSQGMQVEKPEEKIKRTLPPLILSANATNEFSFATQLGAWGSLYLLTFGFLGFVFYRSVGKKEKREDLHNLIKRRMSMVKVKASSGDWRGVGADATNMIYAVIGEIAGLGGASYDFDKIVEIAPPSFRRDLAPKLKKLMGKFEGLGFAPEEAIGSMKDKNELKRMIDETERLLSEAVKYDFSNQESKREELK